MAVKEINLQSPPNTLFQGISTNWQDNLTYQEFLLGVLKKLNEVITQVNADSEYIAEFNTKYTELLAEFEEVKSRVDTLDEEINEEVDAKLTAFRNAVEVQIDNATEYLKAYSDLGDQRLMQEIQNIQLGQIQLIDPTTGITSPLQTVINNVAGTSQNAVTASEYDALNLTASVYDAKEISAFNYDFNGKSILMA